MDEKRAKDMSIMISDINRNLAKFSKLSICLVQQAAVISLDLFSGDNVILNPMVCGSNKEIETALCALDHVLFYSRSTELITLNKDGEKINRELPCLLIVSEFINDSALTKIRENTGLEFKHTGFCYVAQPTKSSQVIALLMTYNFRFEYYNNIDYKNTLFLHFPDE